MANSWEPRNDDAWKDLINHLDEELPDLTSALHILADDITKTHTYNLGCKWVVKVDADAELKAVEAKRFKQTFMDGPAGTSMVTVPTPAVYLAHPLVIDADMKGFIRELRGRLSKSGSGWTTTVASFLHLAGPEDLFDPLTYKPKVKIVPTTGNLLIKVSGIKHLQGHHVYVRVVGATAWDKPIFFGGAKLDLARVSTPATEALEIFVKGVIDNKEVGIESDIVVVPYKNLPLVTP